MSYPVTISKPTRSGSQRCVLKRTSSSSKRAPSLDSDSEAADRSNPAFRFSVATAGTTSACAGISVVVSAITASVVCSISSGMSVLVIVVASGSDSSGNLLVRVSSCAWVKLNNNRPMARCCITLCFFDTPQAILTETNREIKPLNIVNKSQSSIEDNYSVFLYERKAVLVVVDCKMNRLSRRYRQIRFVRHGIWLCGVKSARAF